MNAFHDSITVVSDHVNDALRLAEQASKWDAPVDAQLSTTSAVLALTAEVRAFRQALCECIQRYPGGAS